MRLALPHNLTREEVRRRLHENSHRIGDNIPLAMVEVSTSWPSEDRMALAIGAMGQAISGHVDIEDTEVVFTVELPGALAFVEPMVEMAIRNQGPSLLEPPKG
ncbi:hypothetical protein D2V17_07365 [Aurantiacibacter xanthus]|uniref:Polyhydroxyalkanoic acid synthase n=1 Tax=Aurantiacibacter xanthus TaxID=1784712 RepID=A0A3A1P5N4_9SPHN|nr:polyhydroxyalkanoic acid system family protein [Aurantiacibacter xanthus]RIV88566.1 hypothetical protein D2V17_07365 [Aurantiacibacter xanthus]